MIHVESSCLVCRFAQLELQRFISRWFGEWGALWFTVIWMLGRGCGPSVGGGVCCWWRCMAGQRLDVVEGCRLLVAGSFACAIWVQDCQWIALLCQHEWNRHMQQASHRAPAISVVLE